MNTFLIIIIVLLVIAAILVCFFLQCPGLFGPRDVDDTRLDRLIALLPEEQLVDRTYHYSLVNWTGREKPDAVNTKWPFESRETAEKDARKWGLNREPLHHQAHEPGQKDHFHVSNHHYVKYHNNPSKLYNLHFCYGPEIGENELNIRRQMGYNSRT